MLKIMTWYWRQEGGRTAYTADHVNRWIDNVSRNITVPHRLAVVTDMPEGIDPAVEIIPMSDVVPDWLLTMQGPGWENSRGLPQCYRRLVLYAPDAAERFGADRLVSMDLDCIVIGNLDGLFTDDDFRMFGGTSGKRPYNGSMQMVRAGARPQVWDNITPEGIAESRRLFIGSDQAWISHVLGWEERKWTAADGVYAWSPRFVRTRTQGRRGFCLPVGALLVFFPASPKPWDLAGECPVIESIWRGQEPPESAFRRMPIRVDLARRRKQRPVPPRRPIRLGAAAK